MSEQGWRGFLAAEGLGDWVVLHGGACAVFRLRSLSAAAKLASAIADATDNAASSRMLLTASSDRLTVRLTRDVWQLDAEHIQLARTISTIARDHGAQADRSAVQEIQLAIAAKRDSIDVGFWRAVLGYAPMADDNAVDPLGHGSTVWMQEIEASKSLRHAMHIDVSVARDQAEARLTAAIAAGGRIVDDSQAPSYWTLSDRAGNRVCICAWPDGAALSNAASEEAGK